MNLFLIFPILGVILTNLIGIELLYTYYRNRIVLIKNYNEVLFITIFFNSINWAIYGVVTKNIFVFSCNISSIISCFGFIQILYKHLEPTKLKYIECLTLVFISYDLIIIYIINFTNVSNVIIRHITGSMATISSLCTYFSPLLIIKQVIDSKDTSLIYLPQVLISILNLLSWLINSIIIQDMYQITTDFISLSMCIFQLIVYLTIQYFYQSQKFDELANIV
jgi:solute carrier family 50 protein (sugar transporter)